MFKKLTLAILCLTFISFSEIIFSTNKMEGSKVTIDCEYMKTYHFTDVYTIDETKGVLTVITKTGNKTVLYSSNVIGWSVE